MDIPKEQVEDILKLFGDTISLETPVGEEEDTTLLNFVADTDTPEQFHHVEQIMLREEVEKVLEELSERERRILLLRFGFVEGRIWTLEEIGKEYHVTRERIRQIEIKALRKLRVKKRMGRLKEYIE